ncbi:hypothetical protein PHSY_003764 [Pseudozyma hubeiensis SY62]|uniref:CoA-binding domain-containing protein n=1 Tax=Pseudozyma hubeiensis (strain SY62) TaxID=1305764 RepID=R9P4F3_PSEHS|nr:hypothetical protein PHSY_003764 [Pseudozyma hubeiensis SY62]GAC96184.1 hypothetical protein PHSY_003764 [Pseudozyma hubeiensis SY62]
MANAHINTALNSFFNASKYAVVGASKDPSKFGNKVSVCARLLPRHHDKSSEPPFHPFDAAIQVLKWYQTHSFDITPIHPKEAEIESLATQPDVASFLDKVGAPADKVAISVVTPPKISLVVVQKGLQDQGVATFWLQPGAEDADLVSWVKSQPESIQDRVIYGGPCILVSGRQLAADKGKL